MKNIKNFFWCIHKYETEFLTFSSGRNPSLARESAFSTDAQHDHSNGCGCHRGPPQKSGRADAESDETQLGDASQRLEANYVFDVTVNDREKENIKVVSPTKKYVPNLCSFCSRSNLCISPLPVVVIPETSANETGWHFKLHI